LLPDLVGLDAGQAGAQAPALAEVPAAVAGAAQAGVPAAARAVLAGVLEAGRAAVRGGAAAEPAPAEQAARARALPALAADGPGPVAQGRRLRDRSGGPACGLASFLLASGDDSRSRVSSTSDLCDGFAFVFCVFRRGCKELAPVPETFGPCLVRRGRPTIRYAH
jgi:hypothetical protein